LSALDTRPLRRKGIQALLPDDRQSGLSRQEKVNGDKIFVDSGFIDADAPRGSLVERHRLEKASDELEKRLEEHPPLPLSTTGTSRRVIPMHP
jgi:hypothetical protein